MRKIARGYTIIELVVVIAIIGVLAAITIVGYTSVQQGSRNTQRSSGLAAVSEALEKYYSQNGEYPACAAIAAPLTPNTVVTNTLIGLDPTDLTAPTDTAGTNSFTANCADPATPAKYGYVGGLTTFTLKYKEEGGGVKTAAVARHTIPSSNYSIGLKVIEPSGSVTGAGSYAPGTTPTITATPDAYYDFVSWTGSTGCSDVNGNNTHTITMDGYKQCFASFEVTPITAPAQPAVSANTVGATTTYSWGAAACGGNTAEYQYRYTIPSSGYNSGTLTTGTPSLAYTTSTEGETYTVLEVKARCYNTATTSAWSTGVGGTASYYRPIPQCTLTISGGANGSVNTAVNGSYNCGLTIKASPTITATANTYYYATWSGSTGCVTGAASHTILMDGNKTCTASFAASTITVPAVPTVTANTVGATTTWSWGAASCPGNSARYQYVYSIAPTVYNSGVVATGATSVAFTTSTQGETYTVAVQAECYNTATQSGMSAAGSASYYRPINCTSLSGFILVPGSSTYGTNDFCVMKYEAKQVGTTTTPISEAAGTPWPYISQITAIANSPNVANCTGCHLITEAEWLTIVQNVLSVNANWSGGTVGTGCIFRGNVGLLDACGYVGANPEFGTGRNAKASLTLSNGEVIWDLSGNMSEWTSGTVTTGKPGVTYGGNAWYEWTALNDPGTLSPNVFPSGTGIAGAGGWNSSNGIGRILSNTAETGLRGFLRGGSWGNQDNDGVFSLVLSVAPNDASNYIGFRVSR